MLRAVQTVVDEGLAAPVLVGRREVIKAKIQELGLRLDIGGGVEIVDPQADTGLPLGATCQPFPARDFPTLAGADGMVQVAVCGAHLSGLPLNGQLTQRGGRLLRVVRSAPEYRFYALAGGPPQRPGMVRVAEGGAAVEMEIWELPVRHFGSFVAGIPAPLGIGKVALEDGSLVCGFVCESGGLAGAEDITHYGGWRAWLAR